MAAALNEGSWSLGILMMGVFLILPFPDGHLLDPAVAGGRVAGGRRGHRGPDGDRARAGHPGGGSGRRARRTRSRPAPLEPRPCWRCSVSPSCWSPSASSRPPCPSSCGSAARRASSASRSSGSPPQEGWSAVLFAVTLTATSPPSSPAAAHPRSCHSRSRVLQEASILSFLLLPLAIGARDPALPALRHRPGHQPRPGLRLADRPPGRRLPRLGAAAPAGAATR